MGTQDESTSTPYRDEEEQIGTSHPSTHEEQSQHLLFSQDDPANGNPIDPAEEDDDLHPPPPSPPRWKSFTEPTAGFLNNLKPTTIGFFPTVRAIFNYPPPDIELRSTAWLDGLRGLAAFEVFVFHYCDGWVNNRLGWGLDGEANNNVDSSWWLLPGIRTLFASGDASVCLFFAISGYVLSHRMLKLLRQRRQDEFYSALSSAVFRRGIRLYMPVAIETLLLMLVCRLFGLPKPVEYFPADSLLLEFKSWWVSMVHLFLPLRWPALWYDILNRYDGHISWTIPLEYFGSLVTYLALLAVSRIQGMFARHMVFGIIITHAFAKDDWISAQFVLGMVVADWQLRNEENQKEMDRQGIEPSKSWKTFKAFFFPCVFLFGFYLAGLPPGNFQHRFEGDASIYSRPFYDWISQPLAYFGIYADRQADRYLLCLSGIASVIGVGETPFLRRIAMTRPVQYLGKISFGLYLCHIFMRAWIRPLNQIYVSLVGLTLDDLKQENRVASMALVMAFGMHILGAIPPNFIMGGLFERFLDTPSVNAAKKLEKICIAPVKRDLLPTTSSHTGSTPGANTIQMVDMSNNGRAVRPAPAQQSSRASLPPPTDFEEEEEHTPRHQEGRVRL